MTITPDTMNPTASGTTMKSGYGINEVVTARVSSSQRSATTALQNAVSYFPEFNYDSFWRLLDRVSISSSSSRLEFQTNEYSTYNRRTHFTPIWYPDGAYTVNTWVFKDDDVASTQSARQHKDATDLVMNLGKAQNDSKPENETLVLLIRRLTPLECERLQGFPDGWTDIEGASDSARYKALGNSVAIPCVDYVLQGIAWAITAQTA